MLLESVVLSLKAALVRVVTFLSPLNQMEENTTRPDTRPIPVADGWAGAEMRVFALTQLDHLYGVWTDQLPADGPTDGQSLL